MEHPCQGCLYLRLALAGTDAWCVWGQRAAVQRCEDFAPAPDYAVCRDCLYARWHCANWRHCELGLEPVDGSCEDREVPQAGGEPCDGCRHLRLLRGEERVCTLTATQRYAPTRCKHFEAVPDYAVCRGCVHAAWQAPDRRYCTLHLSPTDDGCDRFEREQFPPPTCPECGAALERVDGRLECPAGHRWQMRKQAGSVCPSCGGQYATLGAQVGDQRHLVYVCPCGWTAEAWHYAGPPRGRSRHGGQRWSPVTGRALVRSR